MLILPYVGHAARWWAVSLEEWSEVQVQINEVRSAGMRNCRTISTIGLIGSLFPVFRLNAAPQQIRSKVYTVSQSNNLSRLFVFTNLLLC